VLLAARNPAANRGVIVLAGWLNVAHARAELNPEWAAVLFPQEKPNAKILENQQRRILFRRGCVFLVCT
jgi:hypothetical protein